MITNFWYTEKTFGDLAQLVRAAALHAAGREFESLSPHQK